MKGIYRIEFGNKFYIGQAKRMATRMYQHERGIAGCMLRYAMPKPYEAHYCRLVQYLLENPSVTFGRVEVIQRCVTAWDLFYAERAWLQDVKENPDCLNGTFEPTRAYINDDVWDIERVPNSTINLFYYLDPRDPAIRYNPYQKLTVHGEIWKQKPLKSEIARTQQLLSSLQKPDTTP